MSDEAAPMGSGARATADDMVMRAIIEVIEKAHPGSRQAISKIAHARLSSVGPEGPLEEEFFRKVRATIDAIVEVPKA